jgi:hypothetical protein
MPTPAIMFTCKNLNLLWVEEEEEEEKVGSKLTNLRSMHQTAPTIRHAEMLNKTAQNIPAQAACEEC